MIKKNKLNINVGEKKTIENSILTKKAPLSSIFDIQLNYRKNLISFFNKIEKVYIIYIK